MAIQEILGIDIGRDAFKKKVNQNFAAHEELISSLNAELSEPDYTPALKRQEPLFSVGTGYDSLGVLQDLKSSIIKGQVPINAKGLSAVNLVKNGNFVDTSKWSPLYAILTVLNNVGIVTGNGTNNLPNIFQPLTIKAETNKKVFVKVKVRVTGIANNIQIYLYGSTSGTIAVKAIDNPIQNQWYSVEEIINVSPLVGNINLKIYHGYVDSATANGKVMEVQKATCIDLTALDLALKTNLECNYMFANWFDGIGSVNNARIKSVGKNLFDITDFIKTAVLGGVVLSSIANGVKLKTTSAYQYLVANKNYKLKPNATVTISANSNRILGSGGGGIAIANSSGAVINTVLSSYPNPITRAVVPSDGIITVYLYATGSLNEYGEVDYTNIQLAENTVATVKEDYQESISYLPDMHSLPNGVVDEIIDGKFVKRIVPYELKASDIFNTSTGEGIDSIFIKRDSFPDIIPQPIGGGSYHILADGFYPNVSNESLLVYNIVDSQYHSTSVLLLVPHGTYSTLADAQTALAGLEIIYERATPIIEDLVTPLTVFPNGTISIESDEETTIPELTFAYPLDIASVIASLNDGVNQLSKTKVNKLQEDWIMGTLKNGWTGEFEYEKNDLGEVTCTLIVSAGATEGLTVIANMPKGYRPKVNVPIRMVNTSGASSKYIAYLNANGNIYTAVDSDFIAVATLYISQFTYQSVKEVQI